jgi:ribosome biogenesis GTPase / thiamine phosphate phosphatase
MSSKSFTCENCDKEVSFEAWGTKNRNHCPFCLFSLHIDNEIGDRVSTCLGLMPAVSKMYKEDGEEVLVHKCAKCGLVRKNRVAGDDNSSLIEKLSVIDYF